eukprot:m.54327 g.54327  ORF g.54327 m.54327 type:complete len:482 (+) comp6836_c1_seq1:107-1552(+)
MSVRKSQKSPPAARKGASPAAGQQCIALFDFTGASPDDLPFKKGDTIVINNTSEDPNWWLATDRNGKQGMIPANYVEPVAGDTSAFGRQRSSTLPRDSSGALLPMPWFHGKISRDLAEQLLTPRFNGLYLIRESTNFPGEHTLCVCHENAVDHYRIQGKDGKITIDEESYFDSLEQLIKHYESDADGLSTRLTKPLVKQGGREFKIDRKKFQICGWEIPRKAVIKSQLLGSGQFGDVFEGSYQGQKVAVKTLKIEQEADVQSFLAEADVMTNLSHPNLVKLIGVCTEGTPIMLITEFMNLGCLKDYLQSRGRSVITPEVLLKLTTDVCSGMAYLEEKNFVHRDLAARNILLTEEPGQVAVAKVADFGLAKDSRLGQSDNGKLPIKWTSPEALRHKVSTSKSDVWSFGVVMWEIYSYGRTPYPRMSQKDVVEQVAKGFRMECPDACSDWLYHNVMMRCWEIDPIKRPRFATLKDVLSSQKQS